MSQDKNKANAEMKAAILRINTDPGRETAGVPLVVPADCHYCGFVFARQPQDFERAKLNKHRQVCQRSECRRSHRIWSANERDKNK